jgi:hypothetical protein
MTSDVIKEVEKYFRERYDFEEANHDKLTGFNNVKKYLAKIMKVKGKDIQAAYRRWKEINSGEEDNSIVIDEIVNNIIKK